MAKFDVFKIEREVERSVLAASHEYDKLVRVVTRKPGLIAAKVQGDQLYFASIWQQTNGTYTQVCTCAIGAPCRHTIALARVIADDINLRTYLEMGNEANKPQESILHKLNWEEEEWNDNEPKTIERAEIIDGTPTPRLTLATVYGERYSHSVAFGYDDAEVPSTVTDELVRGNKQLIRRNKPLEKKYLDELDYLSPATPIVGQEAVAALIRALPPEWEVYLQTDKKTRINTSKNTLSVTTTSNIDWLDIEGKVTLGTKEFKLAEVMAQALNGSQIVRLGNETHLLSTELIDQLRRLSPTFTQATGKLRLSRVQIGLVDELSDMVDMDNLSEKWRETIAAVHNFAGIKQVPVPTEMQTVLRPYQIEGLAYLNFLQETRFGGILADDMGLGKTIQAIAMLLHYYKQNNKLRALIVMPTSVLLNWKSELAKFSPSLSVYVHSGKKRDWNDSQNYNVVLTTYALLRLDQSKIVGSEFDYVILDEAQYTKNVNSKTAKVATKLLAKNRLCLTGTPIENNLTELYSQMHFLNPGLLGTLENFRHNIASPIEKKHVKTVSEHLQRLIRPFILRRTKGQVLNDLPAKTESQTIIELSTEQRVLYDALKIFYQSKVLQLVDKQGVAKSKIQILTALLRLRQACCDPRLVGLDPTLLPESARGALNSENSTKLAELLRIVAEAVAEGHKVLVFSQFVEMIKLIDPELDKLKIKTWILTGSTIAKKRAELMNDFQGSLVPGVFLLSLKAGGVGVNLTAADFVIHYDPWWNPAVESQATDRAHRIGQTKPVSVYKLIAKDTIEEKILLLQDRKRQLVENILAGESIGKELTREDLEYLLS